MTFNKSALAASISLLTLALAGCGGAGSQDSGTGSSSSGVKLSGLVVDPYLAQAKVYIDLDNDGIHEEKSFEKFAFTDQDGFFSKDKNGNSYCDKAATTYNPRHCLDTAGQDLSNAVLRIEGGYDTATGEKFLGSMSSSVDVGNTTSSAGVNPLTSLYGSASTPAQQTAILTFIGAQKSDLTKDFMDSSNADNYSAERFRRAIQVHKAAAILTRALEVKYTWVKAESKVGDKLLPSSAGKFVYDALAAELALNSGTMAATDWEDVLKSAETALRQSYTTSTSLSLSSPAVYSGTETQGIGERVAALFNWFGNLTVSSLTVSTNSTAAEKTEAQEVLKRLARVADLAVGHANKELVSNSTPTSNAASPIQALLTNFPVATANNGLTTAAGKNDTLTTNFKPEADIATAVQSGTTAPNSIAQFTANVDFKTLAGQKLKLSHKTTDSNNVTTKGSIELFFVGATGDAQGVVKGCVITASTASKLSDIEDLTQKGVYLEGRWNKLTDYSANIAITMINTTAYEPDTALVVKRSTTPTNFLFSLEGGSELKSWTGDLSAYGTATLPSNGGCSGTTLPQ